MRKQPTFPLPKGKLRNRILRTKGKPLDCGVKRVEITYRSTIYHVLVSPTSTRLMVDCGWPGTFGLMKHELERKGLAPAEIDYVLVTHFHPDHAGVVEEMKREGARLLLVDAQLAHVARLREYVKPDSGYLDIRTDDAVILSAAESRAFLKGLGFEGEIVTTPGHSPDSVSLLLDAGDAFTGDLTHPGQLDPGDLVSRDSWQKLRERGAKRVLPAHGGAWFLQQSP